MKPFHLRRVKHQEVYCQDSIMSQHVQEVTGSGKHHSIEAPCGPKKMSPKRSPSPLPKCPFIGKPKGAVEELSERKLSSTAKTRCKELGI